MQLLPCYRDEDCDGRRKGKTALDVICLERNIDSGHPKLLDTTLL